jgi:hypothetical protein
MSWRISSRVFSASTHLRSSAQRAGSPPVAARLPGRDSMAAAMDPAGCLRAFSTSCVHTDHRLPYRAASDSTVSGEGPLAE